MVIIILRVSQTELVLSTGDDQEIFNSWIIIETLPVFVSYELMDLYYELKV